MSLRPLCLAVLILSLCYVFWMPASAHAGVWETLARGSHQVFNSQCARPTATPPPGGPTAGGLPAEECDPRTDPVRALQHDARHLNQDVFFAALAEERRLQDQCAVDFATELLRGSRFEDVASDFQDKVQLLAENMASTLRLDHQLSQIAQRRRVGTRGRREGDEAEMERLRQQLRRHLAATAAIENSIPLGSHPEVSRFIQQEVQRLGADAFTLGGMSQAEPPPLRPIERGRFRAGLRDTLRRAQTAMWRDQNVLQNGVRSGGSDLDRATRESLAQDRDLIETFFARNPGLRDSTQAIACQVDAAYGRGAEARDQALLVGSIAATAGSFGVGWLARGGAAAVSLSTPARLAAARGVLTVRSARVLSSAAIGLDTVTGLQQIDTACFQNQRGTRISSTAPATADRCESYHVEGLAQESCSLAVGLTALGIGLSSEAGQRLASRALNRNRQPATAPPVRVDEFAPLGQAPVTTHAQLSATAEAQRAELQRMGVGFRETTDHTVARRSTDWGWGSLRIEGDTPSGLTHPTGQVLQVTQVPPPVARATYRTPALQHPEMAEELARLERMGVRVVVDTSLPHTRYGAVFDPNTRSVVIRPDSSWQIFQHEVQHADFNAYIARTPRLFADHQQVVREGRSLREVLPPEALSRYSPRELQTMERMLRQPYSESAINETLSTNRELALMGWRRLTWNAEAIHTRRYGLNHRTDELARRAAGGLPLSAEEQRILRTAQSQARILNTVDSIRRSAPGVAREVAKGGAIGGAIGGTAILTLIYSEDAREMLGLTSDGRFVRIPREAMSCGPNGC